MQEMSILLLITTWGVRMSASAESINTGTMHVLAHAHAQARFSTMPHRCNHATIITFFFTMA